jgi:protein O-GlcNAc transferase
VLLDLSGHTAHNRLPLFAWKPAPVQAAWLGYFATTGVTEMDYVLVDEIGVPEKNRGHFCEKVLYLPETRLCFSVPKQDIVVAPLPALTNGYITFGCFQNLCKVTDAVLEVWGAVLAKLPAARLRFHSKQLDDKRFTERLYERLADFGISAHRIATHGASAREEYLATLSQVDLVLDTFPYPGGATTCEALWMGVPTLTLAGDTLLARQGASLLSATGLRDWIADDRESYIEKAVMFASDFPELAKRRATLRKQVLTSPLFDAQRFARNFENMLWGMWGDYQQSLSAPIIRKERKRRLK